MRNLAESEYMLSTWKLCFRMSETLFSAKQAIGDRLLRPRLNDVCADCRYEVFHSRCPGACPTSCSPGLPGLITRCDLFLSRLVAFSSNPLPVCRKPSAFACSAALPEPYTLK